MHTKISPTIFQTARSIFAVVVTTFGLYACENDADIIDEAEPRVTTEIDDNVTDVVTPQARGNDILAELDRSVVYDVELDQLVPADTASSLEPAVEELMHVTNMLLSGAATPDQLNPNVVAAFVEREGIGGISPDKSPAGFCAPISCGGVYASSAIVKQFLTNLGYHNVSQAIYGGSQWDYAKSTQGCSLFFSEPKRDEAVVCKDNCKGSCYRDGQWTYYKESNEPDPEKAWCATPSWLVWTAYYHAVC